ncbi:hypothetical protein PLUTE_b0289 [Pseudoalteromonas luteoviolacea DSM 6061]|nr:hypothetical protein [Pseudoalteromonas luteoviolacea DSM 6061]
MLYQDAEERGQSHIVLIRSLLKMNKWNRPNSRVLFVDHGCEIVAQD